MDEAAWLIQKRAQTRSAYSHARLPIKIEAFFSFSFFLFLPKRRPVNAPHSFPVSSHQVRALDFHFAPLYPFADTILFLSSNFGHIRSTRPCFCHHRASKTRQREGDGIDQGRWNNRVSSSSSRERKTISPYRVSPYFPLGLEVGRLPLRSSSRRSILSVRAGSVARHRRAIKEKRIRVSRGNRGEWINNNGRRRYTGVLSAGRWRMHPGHNP